MAANTTFSLSARTGSRAGKASTPTSAIGMRKRNKVIRARRAGFTLIEVLVVVVIIAIVATTAVLAVGTTGRDRELENESERMLALLNYTREQAELRTREYG